MLMQRLGLSNDLAPHAYALVGMAAVLAAVVHAPLASILILFEVTRDYQVVVPAMMAAIVATTTAQLIFRDSIYTATLRQRGVHVGSGSDLTLLRRLTVEQVDLEPAISVHADDPFQKVLDLTATTGAGDFVVLDAQSNYIGMVVADDIKTALMEREAIPLLVAGEIMRGDVPQVHHTDDLAKVLDAFSIHDVSRLPVTSTAGTGRVIGLVSRAALMRRYRHALLET
jgi:CIC family chloride channel protein